MGGNKDNLLKFHSIEDGNMSAATITSPVTSLAYLDDIGVQFNWSGSPVGTFSVEVSIDYAQDLNANVTNSGHWTPLLFSYWDGASFVTSATIPTSVGSPIYLDLALMSAPWIRLKYTKGSSTGTLQAWITAKRL
jgi:hypothetical protein